MNTLKDELRNVANRAIQIHEEAYSTRKDPDDAEALFLDLLEELVYNAHYDIKKGIERFIE